MLRVQHRNAVLIRSDRFASSPDPFSAPSRPCAEKGQKGLSPASSQTAARTIWCSRVSQES